MQPIVQWKIIHVIKVDITCHFRLTQLTELNKSIINNSISFKQINKVMSVYGTRYSWFGF